MKQITFSRMSITRDIIFTLLTLGIWNIVVNIRQIYHLNSIDELEVKFPSFTRVIIYSLLTMGVYFSYHEYKMTKELHRLNNYKNGTFSEVLCFIATLFGAWFLVDTYQQALLNRLADKFNKEKVERNM